MKWWAEYPGPLLQERVVEPLQLYLTDELFATKKLTVSVMNVIKVLARVEEANQIGRKLPPEAFYNELIRSAAPCLPLCPTSPCAHYICCRVPADLLHQIMSVVLRMPCLTGLMLQASDPGIVLGPQSSNIFLAAGSTHSGLPCLTIILRVLLHHALFDYLSAAQAQHKTNEQC